jgi:hypothetical protein
MAMMTLEHAAGIHSAGFIEGARNSGRRPDVALSRLVDELVMAFFVAMAVMWVITTIAGLFRY